MADEEGKGKKVAKKAIHITLNMQKYIKFLSNPIVLYILLGILILLFVVGAISFFTALPGAISGKFAEFVSSLVERSNTTTYEVAEEDVLELAKYLESMGYDLENYGFVEKAEDIEREENIDGDTYVDDTVTRGEIITIKSKYLVAYLGEEAKMYKIAPEGYTYETLYDQYFLNEAIYEVLGSDADEDLVIYYFYYILGQDISGLNLDVQNMYNEGTDKATVNQADEIRQKYEQKITTGVDRQIGAGMLVLQGEAKNEQYKEWIRKVFGMTVNYEFEVDVENRRLLLKVGQQPRAFIQRIFGLEKTYQWSLDLESFTSKYGKPSEFTLALHLATQAPDFVYKLATSNNTDTKVYIDMWPRKENYFPVDANGSANRLSSVVDSALANSGRSICTTCGE